MNSSRQHASSLGAALLLAAAWAPDARGQARPLAPSAGPSAEDKPAILQNVGIDQKMGEPVPLDLEFRDEQGRTVKLGEYFGKRPVVLALVYYECPMLCTLVLNGLVKAMRAVEFDAGREYEVVTVSFDPRETPELARRKKASYVKQYGREGAEDGWHFLTGDIASIQKLTDAVGFRYEYDPTSRQYAHASGVMVLTPAGAIARYLLGIEYSQRDLQLSVMEAGDGKIGTTADQLLLYCYHYNPATGKYGVAVMRILRIAAGMTVLGLASFVTFMIRRERRVRRGLTPVGEGLLKTDD
jgi:protein SCO1/2